MLHRQKLAINFVATPFLGGLFFLLLHRQKFTLKLCKFLLHFWLEVSLCHTSKTLLELFIATFLVRMFFLLKLHKQKFAWNFVATPFLVESLYFLTIKSLQFLYRLHFWYTVWGTYLLFTLVNFGFRLSRTMLDASIPLSDKIYLCTFFWWILPCSGQKIYFNRNAKWNLWCVLG